MAFGLQDSAPLTKKQEGIVAYIRTRVRIAGMPPTHEEIRSEFGLRSTYGVRQHLRLISAKGYIKLHRGKSRGIRLLPSATEGKTPGLADIPVVGQIAAGKPVLAEEHLEGRIAISHELFPLGVLFALRVQGTSMVNIGINEGDLAVIRQQATVENGQVAAVLQENEATLKRVYVCEDHIRFVAENDSVADWRIDEGAGVDVRILGLYVGLIRQARRL